LTEACGNHVSHDALVNLCGINAGALHSLAHNDGAELRGAEIRETALELADWRATRGDDDNVVVAGHDALLQ
jgi:hypothetical protein